MQLHKEKLILRGAHHRLKPSTCPVMDTTNLASAQGFKNKRKREMDFVQF
jgi:hypothetical protein